jgi:hypothetical protein
MFQNTQFEKGKLHLRFIALHTRVDVVGKAMYVKSDGDDYLVGVQSTNKKVDIAQQLLG